MQNQNAAKFKALHFGNQPLILTNVWDAASAAIIQAGGAKALATSSASLAWANGYADGGELPQEILLSSIERIQRVCKVPLSVDIEDGYSNSVEEVVSLVGELVQIGVVGINIEDGDQPIEELAEKIVAIRSSFCKDQLFINARTDVYLRELVNPDKRVSESQHRIQRYAESGADCAFVPGLMDTTEMAELSSSISLPLNIMLADCSQPLGADIKTRVSRISYGPSPFIQAYASLAQTEVTYDALNQILRPQS